MVGSDMTSCKGVDNRDGSAILSFVEQSMINTVCQLLKWDTYRDGKALQGICACNIKTCSPSFFEDGCPQKL